MVSKKTFEAVAAQFAKSMPYVPQGDDASALTSNERHRRAGAWTQWENDVVVIADVFAAENPRFDRIRFYRACGVEVK